MSKSNKKQKAVTNNTAKAAKAPTPEEALVLALIQELKVLKEDESLGMKKPAKSRRNSDDQLLGQISEFLELNIEQLSIPIPLTERLMTALSWVKTSLMVKDPMHAEALAAAAKNSVQGRQAQMIVESFAFSAKSALPTGRGRAEALKSEHREGVPYTEEQARLLSEKVAEIYNKQASHAEGVCVAESGALASLESLTSTVNLLLKALVDRSITRKQFLLLEAAVRKTLDEVSATFTGFEKLPAWNLGVLATGAWLEIFQSDEYQTVSRCLNEVKEDSGSNGAAAVINEESGQEPVKGSDMNASKKTENVTNNQTATEAAVAPEVTDVVVPTEVLTAEGEVIALSEEVVPVNVVPVEVKTEVKTEVKAEVKAEVKTEAPAEEAAEVKAAEAPAEETAAEAPAAEAPAAEAPAEEAPAEVKTAELPSGPAKDLVGQLAEIVDSVAADSVATGVMFSEEICKALQIENPGPMTGLLMDVRYKARTEITNFLKGIKPQAGLQTEIVELLTALRDLDLVKATRANKANKAILAPNKVKAILKGAKKALSAPLTQSTEKAPSAKEASGPSAQAKAEEAFNRLYSDHKEVLKARSSREELMRCRESKQPAVALAAVVDRVTREEAAEKSRGTEGAATNVTTGETPNSKAAKQPKEEEMKLQPKTEDTSSIANVTGWITDRVSYLAEVTEGWAEGVNYTPAATKEEAAGVRDLMMGATSIMGKDTALKKELDKDAGSSLHNGIQSFKDSKGTPGPKAIFTIQVLAALTILNARRGQVSLLGLNPELALAKAGNDDVKKILEDIQKRQSASGMPAESYLLGLKREIAVLERTKGNEEKTQHLKGAVAMMMATATTKVTETPAGLKLTADKPVVELVNAIIEGLKEATFKGDNRTHPVVGKGADDRTLKQMILHGINCMLDGGSNLYWIFQSCNTGIVKNVKEGMVWSVVMGTHLVTVASTETINYVVGLTGGSIDVVVQSLAWAWVRTTQGAEAAGERGDRLKESAASLIEVAAKPFIYAESFGASLKPEGMWTRICNHYSPKDEQGQPTESKTKRALMFIPRTVTGIFKVAIGATSWTARTLWSGAKKACGWIGGLFSKKAETEAAPVATS